MENNELNENEKEIIEKINDLYENLKYKNKNINHIIKKIKEITNIENDNLYFKALLYPEKYKGIKIPDKVPLATCTFQLHTTKLLSNLNDKFEIIFNPYFLYNSKYSYNGEIEYGMTAYKKYGKEIILSSNDYNDAFTYRYLTSFYKLVYDNDYDQFGYVFAPDFVDQGIPNLYSKYRLVSACVELKYVGKLENVSGVLGGTIITENNPYIGGDLYVFNDLAMPIGSKFFKYYDKYIDYKQFSNSIYHKQQECIDGIKLLYFPLDNSFEEFHDVICPENIINTKSSIDNDYSHKAMLECDNNYKNNFNFYIYGLGLPKGNNNFKLDVYCNFECLPNPEYSALLPLNIYNNNLNIKNKQNIINAIRGKCVDKLKPYDNILNWKNILYQIKNKRKIINYEKMNNEIEKINNDYENIKNKINEEIKMDIENYGNYESQQIKQNNENNETEKNNEIKYTETEKQNNESNEIEKNNEIKYTETEKQNNENNETEKNDEIKYTETEKQNNENNETKKNNEIEKDSEIKYT